MQLHIAKSRASYRASTARQIPPVGGLAPIRQATMTTLACRGGRDDARCVGLAWELAICKTQQAGEKISE